MDKRGERAGGRARSAGPWAGCPWLSTVTPDRSVTSFCITRLIASLLPLRAAPIRPSTSPTRPPLLAPVPYPRDRCGMPLGFQLVRPRALPTGKSREGGGGKREITLTGAYLERARTRSRRIVGQRMRFFRKCGRVRRIFYRNIKNELQWYTYQPDWWCDDDDDQRLCKYREPHRRRIPRLQKLCLSPFLLSPSPLGASIITNMTEYISDDYRDNVTSMSICMLENVNVYIIKYNNKTSSIIFIFPLPIYIYDTCNICDTRSHTRNDSCNLFIRALEHSVPSAKYNYRSIQVGAYVCRDSRVLALVNTYPHLSSALPQTWRCRIIYSGSVSGSSGSFAIRLLRARDSVARVNDIIKRRACVAVVCNTEDGRGNARGNAGRNKYFLCGAASVSLIVRHSPATPERRQNRRDAIVASCRFRCSYGFIPMVLVEWICANFESPSGE